MAPMRTTPLVLPMVLAALVGACARTVPSTLPRSSAASLDAPEAPVVSVGRALREEPPLPGEPTEGWEALAPSDASGAHGESSGAHGAHGGHHHAH
jgi:hypothetical protein